VHETEMPPLPDAFWRVWLIEKDGKVFGRLEGARFSDMFWVAYRVIDLTDCAEDRAALFSQPFWHLSPLPTFRHLQTDMRCTGAFAGGLIPTPEFPWVHMRALYPPQRRLLRE